MGAHLPLTFFLSVTIQDSHALLENLTVSDKVFNYMSNEVIQVFFYSYWQEKSPLGMRNKHLLAVASCTLIESC